MPGDDTVFARDHKGRGMKDSGVLGGIYGMAFLGAAAYFIVHATTFWSGVLGFFMALLWPAVVMYRVLELMGL